MRAAGARRAPGGGFSGVGEWRSQNWEPFPKIGNRYQNWEPFPKLGTGFSENFFTTEKFQSLKLVTKTPFIIDSMIF